MSEFESIRAGEGSEDRAGGATSDAPPDRSAQTTEKRLSEARELDALSSRDVLRLMNDQDRTVPEVVAGAIDALAELVEATVRALDDGGRLIYAGAGTSGRLGVLDASECPPTFQSDPSQVRGLIAGGDEALRRSSEGAEDDPDAGRRVLADRRVTGSDVVVGLAAGGTTPWVLGVLGEASGRGATTGLICCAPTPAEVDHLIRLEVGPEVVSGSTRLKAGTATKLALNMLSTTVMVRRGKTYGDLMVDLRASNAKLRDRAVRILISQTRLTRDQASTLLDRADGEVKTALVMARRQLDASAARSLLGEHAGRLRPIIGPPW